MYSIVITTGSLEDIVLITDLIKQKHSVKLLSFKRNRSNIDTIIENIAKTYNIESIQIDISNIEFLFENELTTQLITATYAIALCNRIGGLIYISDHKIDEDINNSFISILAKCISIGSQDKIRLITPYLKLSLTEIIKIGIQLNTRFDLSWTCSTSDIKSCGICKECKIRYNAFKTNCFPDISNPVVSHSISKSIAISKREAIEVKAKIIEPIKSVSSEKQGLISVKEAFKLIKPNLNVYNKQHLAELEENNDEKEE